MQDVMVGRLTFGGRRGSVSRRPQRRTCNVASQCTGPSFLETMAAELSQEGGGAVSEHLPAARRLLEAAFRKIERVREPGYAPAAV